MPSDDGHARDRGALQPDRQGARMRRAAPRPVEIDPRACGTTVGELGAWRAFERRDREQVRRRERRGRGEPRGLDLLKVPDGTQHGGCRGAAVAEVKGPRAAVLASWRLVAVRGAAGMRHVALSDDMHHVFEGFARAREDDEERQDSSDAADPNHLETVSQRPCHALVVAAHEVVHLGGCGRLWLSARREGRDRRRVATPGSRTAAPPTCAARSVRAHRWLNSSSGHPRPWGWRRASRGARPPRRGR